MRSLSRNRRRTRFGALLPVAALAASVLALTPAVAGAQERTATPMPDDGSGDGDGGDDGSGALRELRRERRQTGLQNGMSELATVIGWDTARTIREGPLGAERSRAPSNFANLQPFAPSLVGGTDLLGDMNPAMGTPGGGADGLSPMDPTSAAAMAAMNPMGAAGALGGMGAGGMSMGALDSPPVAPGAAVQPTDLLSTGGASESEMLLNGAAPLLAEESALQKDPPSAGSSTLLRLWARGSRQMYNNEAVAGRWTDGDFITGFVGIDATWASGLVLGVAMGGHRAEIGFVDTVGRTAGNMDVEMWSVNPYVSFQNSVGIRFWGNAGVGSGALDYGDSGRLTVSDLSMTMATGGIEYEIAGSDNYDLIARTDGMFVNFDVGASDDAYVGYQRFDAAAAGRRGELELGLPLGSESVGFRPYGQLAYRYDGGDAKLGSSVEYGGGVAITGTLMFVDASIRNLVSTGGGSFDSTGYSLAIGYDGGANRRGLSLRFEQSAGPTRYNPYGGGGGLPFLPTYAAGQSYRARGGYGLDFGSGLLTPWMEADWGGAAGYSRLNWGAAWERPGMAFGASYSLMNTPGGGVFGNPAGVLSRGAFTGPFGDPAGGVDHAVRVQARIGF